MTTLPVSEITIADGRRLQLECREWVQEQWQVESNGKVHLITCHEGRVGEFRYICTLSLTSALDGMSGQCHAPAALPPGMTRYPMYERRGGPYGWSGGVRKISSLPGFDPRTVQPVASRYTD
jgi:hypothetical protein